MTDHRLHGGWQTDVHRSGGVVYRSPGPQSATVLALLRHLEAAGFDAAPRVVGTGLAPDGRETLRYVEGRSPQPAAWSDEALVQMGALLRRLHRATATFDVAGAVEAVVRSLAPRRRPGDRSLRSRPVERTGAPRSAGGVHRLGQRRPGRRDVGAGAGRVAERPAPQLHDDDVAERNHLPAPDERAAQLRLLVDSYGLGTERRESFVDRIAEFAVHAARQEAVDAGVTPDSDAAIADDGFPVLWAITWRARSASWILRNRQLLSKALRA